MLFVQHLLDVEKNIKKNICYASLNFLLLFRPNLFQLFSEIIYFMRLIYGIADDKINSKDKR